MEEKVQKTCTYKQHRNTDTNTKIEVYFKQQDRIPSQMHMHTNEMTNDIGNNNTKTKIY